jgi:manganese/iron transport system permease protein
MSVLLDLFNYQFMINTIWVSALVGAVCAFLSAYLMLKGWPFIGGALIHSIVPRVAGAYMLGLPFALGAFCLAAKAMLFLRQRLGLKEDAVIGLSFTSFFGLGLFMVSLNPMGVSIQTIITMGNILAITSKDSIQMVTIGGVSLVILQAKWCDLLAVFFDEAHARTIGLNPGAPRFLFFTLPAACTVAAMQTVGAFLVITLVVTPGAIAFLLTRRFSHMMIVSVGAALLSGMIGLYASYWLDSAPAPTIVLVLTAMFIAAPVANNLRTNRASA